MLPKSPKNSVSDADAYSKHNSFSELKSAGCDASTAIIRIQKILGSSQKTIPQDLMNFLTKICTAEAKFSQHVLAEIKNIQDNDLVRYLSYRYRYENYPVEHLIDDYPPTLQVEPTSVCNFRCVFCYQTDSTFALQSSGHMGFMDINLFKKVIDEAQGNIESVTLASRGEPLLFSLGFT